ncbi:MAG: hydroxysqualene dehydroxylase HpnE [Planctomycetota bacterium]|nr:hydroxysqualene dehydroxylase HpnE [Planctomycetota bacterium]
MITAVQESSRFRKIIVVGGGLAGMAAAVALEAAGRSVTLIESRKMLGGRAGSFEDPQTGEILDNCQHVLLGCCTNLLDFYRRIGAEHFIGWQGRIRFVDSLSRGFSLWATPGLPAPLHLALAGIGFSALTLAERTALGEAMLAMLRLGRAGRDALADVPFGQWLAEHRQPRNLIDQFYDLVLVSALNEDCRRASAAYAIQVFQEGMLSHSSAYRMGTPACPLAELYAKLPCRDVRLGARLSQLRFEGDRVVGAELSTGEMIDADAVILAVNYQSLEKFVPTELYKQDSRFSRLSELQSVPILGAHLWFDRPILTAPHAALMTTPLQWLFRKPGENGRAVHGVISAARDWVGRPREECLEIFERQIRRTIPAARGAKLQRGVIVVEKRATFSPLPGVDRLRPSQSPPREGIAGLFLAGDYTQTGWPATMEGAVRSGYLAAEGLLGKPGGIIVPDLPLQWPAKLLA